MSAHKSLCDRAGYKKRKAEKEVKEVEIKKVAKKPAKKPKKKEE